MAAGCLSRKPAQRSAPAPKSSGRHFDELRLNPIAHAQTIARFITISRLKKRRKARPDGKKNDPERCKSKLSKATSEHRSDKPHLPRFVRPAGTAPREAWPESGSLALDTACRARLGCRRCKQASASQNPFQALPTRPAESGSECRCLAAIRRKRGPYAETSRCSDRRDVCAP